jgi:hypothetical protein
MGKRLLMTHVLVMGREAEFFFLKTYYYFFIKKKEEIN